MLVALLVAVAATPQLGGATVMKAIDALHGVSPSWLALAGLAFAASIVCSAGSWACALAAAGGSFSLPDATARYSIGGLVNTVLPARAGDALRIALFSKRLRRRNRVWATGGAFAAIGVARAAWTAVLVLAAFSTGALPLWPAFALGGAAIAAIVLVIALRHRTGDRLRSTLEALETLRHSPRRAAKLVAWIGGSTVARVAAAAAVAAAMGIHSPLVAALLIVPALDVAGVLPLTPGNLGVASGAVAVALVGTRRRRDDRAVDWDPVPRARDAHEPGRRCGGRARPGAATAARAAGRDVCGRRRLRLPGGRPRRYRAQPGLSRAAAVLRPVRPGNRLAREAVLSAAAAAAAASLLAWLGPPGSDLAAHAYQRAVFLQHGFSLWNNFWYAGRYSFVTYSLIYYPLAALLGIRLLAVATVAMAALAFAVVLGREWGPTARWSSRTFAVVWAGIVLSAAFPFALGAALALLTIWALQAGARWRFAALALLDPGGEPGRVPPARARPRRDRRWRGRVAAASSRR